MLLAYHLSIPPSVSPKPPGWASLTPSPIFTITGSKIRFDAARLSAPSSSRRTRSHSCSDVPTSRRTLPRPSPWSPGLPAPRGRLLAAAPGGRVTRVARWETWRARRDWRSRCAWVGTLQGSTRDAGCNRDMQHFLAKLATVWGGVDGFYSQSRELVFLFAVGCEVVFFICRYLFWTWGDVRLSSFLKYIFFFEKVSLFCFFRFRLGVWGERTPPPRSGRPQTVVAPMQ